MKYTININQFALFNAGLYGKVDYSDIAILEYLKDFVYYKDHKAIRIKDNEYIWLNYNHLIDSLPFAYFKTKAAVSKRITKLQNLELISTYRAKDNTLYYTFTDKMIDLLFSKQTFKPQRTRQDRSSIQKSHLYSPSAVPVASAVKDSSGFASMSGNVWKVLSNIRERQCSQIQNSKVKVQNER